MTEHPNVDPSEYRVYVVQMPPGIRGAVRISPDGFFNVYISDALSPAARRRTLDHELNHIARDDFFSDRPIEEIENN